MSVLKVNDNNFHVPNGIRITIFRGTKYKVRIMGNGFVEEMDVEFNTRELAETYVLGDLNDALYGIGGGGEAL